MVKSTVSLPNAQYSLSLDPCLGPERVSNMMKDKDEMVYPVQLCILVS